MEQIIGSGDYRAFLNTRNELYREMDMKNNPPSREEALRLMSENPNLIRRPILIDGGTTLVGFDAEQWQSVAGG